jgi:hypothetical protein
VLPLLGISTLLMAYEANGRVPDDSEPADNRGIVSELTIAMNLDKILADVFHVIQEVGTLGVPCELYLLVRREVIHI